MPTAATNQPTTFLEREAWVRAVLASDLPPVAARVAIAIGLHLNVKTGRCDPGIDDIIAASHVPERSLYRQITLLEEAGWIAVKRVRGQGRRNQYTLVFPDTAMAGNNPDTAMAGKEPLYPATGGSPTLPKRALYPANRWQDKDKRQAKRQASDATTSDAGERERELALADPGAPAPAGGAREGLKEDRFAELLAVWSVRPWGDDDETDACLAFAFACREADPDDIIASARAWVAAADAPRFLKPLTKWLTQGLWKKPPPSRKQTRGSGKVSAAEWMRRQGEQS